MAVNIVINNPLQSAELDTIDLKTPAEVEVHRQYIADRLNKQCSGRTNSKGGKIPQFHDLTTAISDVQIETTAQGASTLVVSVIDPMWQLFTTEFITTDQSGFLYPQIIMRFPANTGPIWQLVACEPTTELSNSANVTLTFEDRIAALLGQTDTTNGGVNQSRPSETLGAWIARLCAGTNKAFGLKGDEAIQVIQWISPRDPNSQAPAPPYSGSQPKRSTSPLQKQINEAMKNIQNQTEPQLSANPPSTMSLLTPQQLSKLPRLSSSPPHGTPRTAPGGILGPGNQPHFHG